MVDLERDKYSVYFQAFSYVRDNVLSKFCSKETNKIKKQMRCRAEKHLLVKLELL